MFFAYLGLNLAVLIMLAWLSRGGGLKLWLAVAVFGWTVSQFNTLIEAVAFRVMPLPMAAIQLAVAGVVFALFAGLAILLTGRRRASGQILAEPDMRLPVLALIVLGYELLYWTAGTLVWPFIAAFYNAKGLPPAWFVAALQVPRALIFVGAVWPWLRTNPRAAPLAIGIAFAVLGGIAPALPDNPLMPPNIRFAHAIEAGTSNFLFGLLVGWLLRPRAAGRNWRKADA